MSSVKKKVSPAGRLTTKPQTHSATARSRRKGGASAGSEYEKLAPGRGKPSRQPFPSTSRTVGSTRTVVKGPTASTHAPPAPNRTQIDADSVFHLFSKRIASPPDEIMFILAAEKFGVEQAEYLASTLQLQCQRPLQALRRLGFGGGRKKSTVGGKKPKSQPSSRRRPKRRFLVGPKRGRLLRLPLPE